MTRRTLAPRLSTTALWLSLLASSAVAQDVRLTSTDGFTDFRGELVDFDGEKYVLKTNMGTLTFPAADVSCEGAACPEVNTINSAFTIAGAPNVLRFAVPELLNSYSLTVDTDILRTESPEGVLAYELLTFDGDKIVDVKIEDSGSEEAMDALIAGDAALAILSRRITDREAAALTANRGRSMRAIEQLELESVLAVDALVVLAGADVPIEAITVRDLASIYSGAVTNWAQIGGPDLPLSAFTREVGSEVADMLETLVLEPNRARLGASVITVDTNDGVSNAIRSFPNSIGIAAISAMGEDQAVRVTDGCGRAILPDAGSIKLGIYPLTASLYAYKSPDTLPVHARGMVDFALSNLGQQLLSDVGYVNTLPILVDPSEGGGTPGESQLTSIFEVPVGGGLGSLDVARLDRLAALIRTGALDGQLVSFVGKGGEGRAAAAQVMTTMFSQNTDIEEQLTVAFRAVDGGPITRCDGPGEGTLVEVWARPLSEG